MAGYNFPEPYVANVKTPDFGKTIENALSSRWIQGRVADQSRTQEADNVFAQAQQGGMSGPEAANVLRQRGFGDKAVGYDTNIQGNAIREGTAKAQQAELYGKAHEYLLRGAGLAQNQDEWNAFIDNGERMFGLKAPNSIRAFTPEIQRRLATSGMTGVQQINTEIAQRQDQRAQEASGREAQLQPGRVEAQGLSNTGHALDNQGKQAAMDAVDEGYALPGGRFMNTTQAMRAYHEAKSGNFDPEFTFDKFVSGLKPAAKHRKTGQITVDETAAPPSATPSAADSPAGGGAPGGYASMNDVVAAHKSGKLSRDEAARILKEKGWAQ